MGDAIKVKTSSVLMYAGDETAPHNDAMRLSLKRERVGNPEDCVRRGAAMKNG